MTGAVEVGEQVGGKGGQALIGAILAVTLIPARVEGGEAEPGGF